MKGNQTYFSLMRRIWKNETTTVELNALLSRLALKKVSLSDVKMKNRIIDHWTFTVEKDGRSETVKVEGVDACNTREARKYASGFGKVTDSITVYQKK